MACAALQWNDPDPWMWIAIYGIAAAAAVANAAGVRPIVPNVVAMLVALVGLVASAPEAVNFMAEGNWGALFGEMSADQPNVESAREFIGSIIITDYLALSLVLGLRRRSTHQER